MRWLMLALLVSVVALLIAAGGVALHIRREHSRRRATSPPGKDDAETEETQ